MSNGFWMHNQEHARKRLQCPWKMAPSGNVRRVHGFPDSVLFIGPQELLLTPIWFSQKTTVLCLSDQQQVVWAYTYGKHIMACCKSPICEWHCGCYCISATIIFHVFHIACLYETDIWCKTPNSWVHWSHCSFSSGTRWDENRISPILPRQFPVIVSVQTPPCIFEPRFGRAVPHGREARAGFETYLQNSQNAFLQTKHGEEFTNTSHRCSRARDVCAAGWVGETFQKVPLEKRSSPCWHRHRDNGAKIAETARGIKTSLVELRRVPNHLVS